MTEFFLIFLRGIQIYNGLSFPREVGFMDNNGRLNSFVIEGNSQFDVPEKEKPKRHFCLKYRKHTIHKKLNISLYSKRYI